MILLIDNYDSFTWNLAHLVAAATGEEAAGAMRVARNDQITVAEARALDGGRGPNHVILSPGPCGPAEAGVSVDMVREFAGRVPVLGVCLGHQCIAAAFGMKIERLAEPIHGLATRVQHDGRGLFAGLPTPLPVARYHSLAVPEAGLKHGNGDWEVSAWMDTPHGRIAMGLRRVWDGKASLDGVQFHPESFLTEHGVAMMRAFLGDRVAP